MRQKIQILRKFKPILEIAKGNPEYKGIDTVIITGGRNSFKSFHVALISVILIVFYRWKILFSRYTWASAKDSIIEEVKEKIQLLNVQNNIQQKTDRFIVGNDNLRELNENDLDNLILPQIIFKGIKTSSGNQTANLKSLKGFNCFIVDEGEEQPSYKDWRKVKRSLRRNDLPNIAIIVLNPTPKTHWIYTEFFEKKGIKEGYNGIKDNVLYIHSIYTDKIEWVTPENIRDFEKTKTEYNQSEIKKYSNDPDIVFKNSGYYKKGDLILSDEYKFSILGGFRERSEGVIFKNWSFGSFTQTKKIRTFGLDFGFEHPTALVQVEIKGRKLYAKEFIYKSGLNTFSLISEFKKVGITNKDIIYADSARPDEISDLKKARYYVKPANKKAGSVNEGISRMLKYDLIFEGENLGIEANNYKWADRVQEVPEKKYDDALDAIRYILPFAEKI